MSFVFCMFLVLAERETETVITQNQPAKQIAETWKYEILVGNTGPSVCSGRLKQ